VEVFATILLLAFLHGILLFGIIWLASYRFKNQEASTIQEEMSPKTRLAAAKRQNPSKK
jgi:hypothetical protein|tara:strand:- start:277 stop:453 length:177 start_codon:yes stop_codon:yes gene_type:complete